MVTKEQVAEAYLNQERLKKEIPLGSSLSGENGYYYSSPFEPFATAALILQHVMFEWECEYPAPKGHSWTCSGRTGFPVLIKHNTILDDGTVIYADNSHLLETQ